MFRVKLLLSALLVTSLAWCSSARRMSADSKKICCTKQGGKVQDYVLYNGKAPNGIPMASPMQVCSIPNKAAAAAGSVNDANLVALDTLTSTKPTLAALAFQARIPPQMPATRNGSNPSNLYCNQLGGTTAMDNAIVTYLPIPNAKLGWWNKKSDGSWRGGFDFCRFPDGSAMSPLTLFLHANTDNSANEIKFSYKTSESKAPVLGGSANNICYDTRGQEAVCMVCELNPAKFDCLAEGSFCDNYGLTGVLCGKGLYCKRNSDEIAVPWESDGPGTCTHKRDPKPGDPDARCAGAYGQPVPCVECSTIGYNCVPKGTRCMTAKDWILYGTPGTSNTCGYGLNCMDYDDFPRIGTCK